MVQVVEDVEIIERVAALDIGKAEVVCCVRVPDESRSGRGAGRGQHVRTFATMTRSLTDLSDWLTGLRVTRVVMEATSDYWKPPFYLLEAAGFDVWLVNAHEVKHLPGRPKTDALDAVWPCKIAERQMIRASFVPPAPIRQLRDLTRYRIDLIGDRGREKNRVEKLPEDAGIKLSVVASDLFGVSGRAMMDALIAGERDPDILADLARTRLRARIPELREALTGHFTDHHGFLLSQMLRHVDHLDGRIAAVEAQIEDHIRPYADTVARLDQIPGIGPAAAGMTIAEIGIDMTRFPTAAHLASWAKFSPTVKESAGKTKGSAATGRGNRYLARALGEAAVGASRTNTFLGERYRRVARRRGKQRALVAIGRSILTVIWHLLSDPDATFNDLGADHYDNRGSTQRGLRRHVNALHALGFTVTITPTG
ncbi:transposase [Humibacillus xanthopallidus]|uniref:Transposase n=1 Tax=Humibacillus xanthopallidus TaxID=412689 RepID=A0A543I391_9MICO|nr:transposase [Humibacillus xanthopallidus]